MPAYQPTLPTEPKPPGTARAADTASNDAAPDTWIPLDFGRFTGPEGQTEETIHYLTNEEAREMDPPFPPEPGYDD